eukprot:GFUD01005709.1.p1 GENE.GFUD01005709.1~~GFUD01005709.1.p1  ORF type:complete len:248 (+),score=63.82 GFUD01005709.1:116-859(+)
MFSMSSILALAPSYMTMCMAFGLTSFYCSIISLTLQMSVSSFQFSVHELDTSHISLPTCSKCIHENRFTSLLGTYRVRLMEASMWLHLLLLLGCSATGWALYEGARTGRSWLVTIFIYWSPCAFITIVSSLFINFHLKTSTDSDLFEAVAIVFCGGCEVYLASLLRSRRFYVATPLARVLGVNREQQLTVLEVVDMVWVYLGRDRDNLSDGRLVVSDPELVELFGSGEVTCNGMGRHLERFLSDDYS